MGNTAQPKMFSRSRRRDVKGEYVKSPRTWSERQEMRGDDLTALARVYPRMEQPDDPFCQNPGFYDDHPVSSWLQEEQDASPRDESLEAWVRRTERQENGISSLLCRVNDALNPFMAKWLTAETLDELTAVISALLPHIDGSTKARLQHGLERLTTWSGLGEYLGRLAEAKRFEEQLAEERTRRLEATSRRPRTRPGNRR